ncbi:gluconokinase [Angustibacter aerolatus]
MTSGTHSPRSPLLVVMGVSGSGKTTTGEALAARLGLDYADADGFHPPANVAKMAAGHPLDDADRAPWLRAIGTWLAEHDGVGGVVTCSALRVTYRDVLRQAAPRLRLVHVSASREVLRERVGARRGHFMPPELLDSQLATLEPLAEGEHGVTVDVGQPVDAVVDDALRGLGLSAQRTTGA